MQITDRINNDQIASQSSLKPFCASWSLHQSLLTVYLAFDGNGSELLSPELMMNSNLVSLD